MVVLTVVFVIGGVVVALLLLLLFLLVIVMVIVLVVGVIALRWIVGIVVCHCVLFSVVVVCFTCCHSACLFHRAFVC